MTQHTSSVGCTAPFLTEASLPCNISGSSVLDLKLLRSQGARMPATPQKELVTQAELYLSKCRNSNNPNLGQGKSWTGEPIFPYDLPANHQEFCQ